MEDDILPLDRPDPEDIQLVSSGSERKVIPSGYYVAEITAAGAVENPWYDKYVEECEAKGELPNEARMKQIQIDFKVEHEGEEAPMRHWVSPIISKGKKTSNLYALLLALGFDPVTPPKTSELVGRTARINILKAKKDDGSEYNKVVGGTYESL